MRKWQNTHTHTHVTKVTKKLKLMGKIIRMISNMGKREIVLEPGANFVHH
jgi:hypothetical protein